MQYPHSHVLRKGFPWKVSARSDTYVDREVDRTAVEPARLRRNNFYLFIYAGA